MLFIILPFFVMGLIEFSKGASDDTILKEIQILKGDIKTLKADNQILKVDNQYLNEKMKTYEKQLTARNGYCQIHENKCGTCTCVEDLNLDKRYYCDCQGIPARRDCKEHYVAGERTSGVYRITANIPGKMMQVYCDQIKDGGGWTVFQRRSDGSINFYRDWDKYKHGFGKPHHEHWLGNDNLFFVTAQAFYKGSELRVEMVRRDNSVKLWAKYADFKVDEEKKNYMLHVNGFTGNVYNGFGKEQNKMGFSTYDRDNDKHSSMNCAAYFTGAWWYNACHLSNLNGAYDVFQQLGTKFRISWYDGTNHVQLKFSEMKVRRN